MALLQVNRLAPQAYNNPALIKAFFWQAVFPGIIRVYPSHPQKSAVAMPPQGGLFWEIAIDRRLARLLRH
jgi:hypothetical protein